MKTWKNHGKIMEFCWSAAVGTLTRENEIFPETQLEMNFLVVLQFRGGGEQRGGGGSSQLMGARVLPSGKVARAIAGDEKQTKGNHSWLNPSTRVKRTRNYWCTQGSAEPKAGWESVIDRLVSKKKLCLEQTIGKCAFLEESDSCEKIGRQTLCTWDSQIKIVVALFIEQKVKITESQTRAGEEGAQNSRKWQNGDVRQRRQHKWNCDTDVERLGKSSVQQHRVVVRKRETVGQTAIYQTFFHFSRTSPVISLLETFILSAPFEVVMCALHICSTPWNDRTLFCCRSKLQFDTLPDCFSSTSKNPRKRRWNFLSVNFPLSGKTSRDRLKIRRLWWVYLNLSDEFETYLKQFSERFSLFLSRLFQEFLSERNDASLFLFGSHSKKRPHNLVLGNLKNSFVGLKVQFTANDAGKSDELWRFSLPWIAVSSSFLCSTALTLRCVLFSGRLFDHHVLDMIELGIENHKPMSAFEVRSFGGRRCLCRHVLAVKLRKTPNVIVTFSVFSRWTNWNVLSCQCAKVGLGTKPCLTFAGEFEQNAECQRLKSLLIGEWVHSITPNVYSFWLSASTDVFVLFCTKWVSFVFTDFFRGPVVSSVRLKGLEHLCTFTLHKGNLFMRSYRSVLWRYSSSLCETSLCEILTCFPGICTGLPSRPQCSIRWSENKKVLGCGSVGVC